MFPIDLVESIIALKCNMWKVTNSMSRRYDLWDPNNKEKWTSLGDYLEKLNENPQFMEQVASGVTAPNIIQLNEQQVKEELKKQKKEDDNFNPYRFK